MILKHLKNKNKVLFCYFILPFHNIQLTDDV